MAESLKGLVILVTGASSGLGAGIAEELARLGAKLSLTGRNQERLEQTATKCKEAGLPDDHVMTVIGDVTVKEDIDNIVSSTVKHFGKLDVLVNNAGETRSRPIETCEVEDLDFVYNALLRSVFMMSKAAIPHLAETKGAIINMSSVAGLRPYTFGVPYSMCKHAVDRLTQILANSEGVAGKGIRVNSVNPGTVKTEIFYRAGALGNERAAKFLDWCERAFPVGRLGEVGEVARLVAFLCSHDACFLNGVLFPIDGGYHNTSFIPKPGQKFRIAFD